MVASNSDIVAALSQLGLNADFNKLQAPTSSPVLSAPAFKGTGDIFKAISALKAIGDNYKDPLEGFVAPTPQVQANPYRLAGSPSIDWSGVGGDFGKQAPTDSSPSWKWLYNGLNDTLGQAGGLIRTTIDNGVNGVKNELNTNDPWYEKAFKSFGTVTNAADDAIINGVVSGAKNQWKDWTDGKLSFGDIPMAGFLHGMSDSYASGNKLNQDMGLNDLLDNKLGLKNSMLQNGALGKWNKMLAGANWMNYVPVLDALHQGSQGIMAANPNGSEGVNSLAGLVTEGVTDPLTYFDGVGIATKAGKLTELNKIGEWGSKIGMDTRGIRNTNEFIDAATNHLTNQYAEQFPNLASDMAKAVTDKAREDISDAHAATYNENLNKVGFSIPFSNAHASIGTMPEKLMGIKNPLFKSEAILGDNYAHLAKNVVNQLAGGNATHVATIENGFKNYYKVDDLSKLTKTQFTDMLNRADQMKPTLDKIIGTKGYKGSLGTKVEETIAKSEPISTNGGLHGDPLVNFAQSGKPTARGAIPTVENPARYGVENLQNKADVALKNGKGNPLEGHPMVGFGQNGNIKGRKIEGTDIGRYTKEDVGQRADGLLKNLEDVKNSPAGGWNHKLTDIQTLMNKIKNDKRTKKGLTIDELYARALKKDPTLPSSFDQLIHMAQLEHAGTGASQSLKSLLYGDPAINEALNKLNELGKTSEKVEPTIQHVTEATNDVIKPAEEATTKLKNFKLQTDGKNNTVNLNKALADLQDSKYTRFNNAKSLLDHLFEGKNPFNARTLGTGDKFLNSMANHIADANSYRVGNIAQYSKPINKISEYIKKNGIEEKDMLDTIYHLEGKAPYSYGENWSPSSKVSGLADMIKPVLDKLGSSENKAGVLDALKEKYFPHVNNLSPEDAKSIADFTDRHPELKGQSEQNAFNNERKTFPTMADRQNYLDKLDQKMQTTTDPHELNSMTEQFNKVKGMFNTDIPSALTSRIREGVRAESMKAMHGELGKYGMLLKDPKEAPPAGFTKLDSSQMKKFGLSDGQYHIQKDVLKGMERIDGIFKHDGMEKFVRQVGAFTDIFRAGVTTYKLSHYVNNILGNVINNMAAGVKISEYNAARKLIQAMRNGTTTAAQDAILKSAFDKNVISGGFVSDLAAHGGFHVDDPTKLEKFANMVGNNKFAKGIRQKGELVDDVSRLGNYINGLNKFGGDSAKAAEQVRTYLFNYNEMTNADRVARTVIPFWNWTKRNIPLQMKNLVERPSIAMNFERAKVATNENQKGADWQKDTGFKLPFMDRYTSVPSPTDDLKQIMHPVQFLSSLTPAIRMPIEMATNRQLYTGNPISYGKNTLQAADVPNYVAKNFGIAGNANDFIQAIAGTNKKTVPEVIDNFLKTNSKINPKSGVN